MSFSEDERARQSPRDTTQEWDELAEEPRLLTRRDGTEPNVRTFHRASFILETATERDPPPRYVYSSRPPHVVRRLLLTVICLLLIAILGFAVTAVWLRHAMRAALPQIDGILHVAGLSAPVVVTRNVEGVPSIRASNIDDLLFAQGFVTAQDRLWQMDMLRRYAAGELAEILGPGFVQHDKQQRYLQLRAAADRAIATLSPEQLHDLQAYARGVNAFIGTHRDRLPLEFHLLHYQPRAWTPRDTLLVSLVMWQDLSTSFPEKLNREALTQHLPPSLLSDLYPVGSWRDRPPTQQPEDLTAPRVVQQIPLDSTQSKLEAQPSLPSSVNPHDLLAVSSAFAESHCDDCRAGSNNWVVAGTHSASGEPLVSNDMHLHLSLPDVWYEAVLRTSSASGSDAPIDIAGFTLPGVPWVLVGRNAHVAWSLTNLGGDVQDVWIEHLRRAGADMQFKRADGVWLPVQHHSETIAVRGGRNITLDVLTVPHTVGATTIESPVISPLYPSERRTLSLSWTIYDPTVLDFSFRDVDASTDAASLVASFAGFGGPSLNLLYADDQGHIGYHALGKIPIRGPAVQHPRAVPQFVLPPPEPESDEEDDDTQAKLLLHQQLPDSIGPATATATPAVFVPGFSSSVSGALWHQTAYSYAARRRVHSRIRTKTIAPLTNPAPLTQTVASSPLTEDFTIGSPLSPVPIDASNAEEAWSSYIPYNDLPAIQDPASGVLATANSRITADNYPYAIALNWIDPYRVERIYHLLDDRNGLTPRTMLAIQTDQHSDFDLLVAQRVAYAIDHSSAAARGNDTAHLRQAANLLRDWQGDVVASSPAAAIVSAIHDELWPSLLVPRIMAHDRCSRSTAAKLAQIYTWGERTSALEELLNDQPSRWLPRGIGNWNDLLTLVTRRALKDKRAPRDLSRWSYGAIHTIEIGHPLFGDSLLARWLLGVRTSTGAQPAGGDPTTIDAIGRGFGPSERFTADLADRSDTLANLTTGESGNPASSWYLDQFASWLHGRSFTLPTDGGAAEHKLTLLPGS